jgi:hypothetical protein
MQRRFSHRENVACSKKNLSMTKIVVLLNKNVDNRSLMDIKRLTGLSLVACQLCFDE